MTRDCGFQNFFLKKKVSYEKSFRLVCVSELLSRANAGLCLFYCARDDYLGLSVSLNRGLHARQTLSPKLQYCCASGCPSSPLSLTAIRPSVTTQQILMLMLRKLSLAESEVPAQRRFPSPRLRTRQVLSRDRKLPPPHRLNVPGLGQMHNHNQTLIRRVQFCQFWICPPPHVQYAHCFTHGKKSKFAYAVKSLPNGAARRANDLRS